MKIGILTYHRTLNYGACLQAVATRIILERMGHEVYYVDYWPKYHSQGYKTFSLAQFMKLPSIGWKLNYLFSTFNRKKRNDNFSFFHNKYIIPYCRPISEEYDVVVYGSDQIWRKQKHLKDYNPVYFGENECRTQRHIAFSGSMGVLPDNETDRNTLPKLLSNFEKIAVREDDLFELVKSLGYSNVEKTLDPTLLLNSKDWDTIIDTPKYSEEPYVLVYSIGKVDAFNMDSIQKYASQRKLTVKNLSGTPSKSDTKNHITTAGPYEFLRLIKNAECVFTSSFHGLVFSLLYSKEVYASFTHNSNRAKTLLKSVGLEERFIRPNQDIPSLERIDFSEVKCKLEKLRESTMKYLNSITN